MSQLNDLFNIRKHNKYGRQNKTSSEISKVGFNMAIRQEVFEKVNRTNKQVLGCMFNINTYIHTLKFFSEQLFYVDYEYTVTMRATHDPVMKFIL